MLGLKLGIGSSGGGLGKAYYISNTGNDANNGLAPATAWQTIAKVNASTFLPGDQILFKRGDTWRETLTVPSSGSAGRYITFGAYGTGDKPKILGSDELTSWNNGVVGTPANNDILSETFNGAGYSSPTWTEYIGANTGCLVDENNTDIADSAEGGSDILKIVKVITPTGTPLASRGCTMRDLGANKNIAYIDFYVYISAYDLPNDTNAVNIFKGANAAGGGGTATALLLCNYSGTVKFRFDYYNNGATPTNRYLPPEGILNYWHHIQFLYDVTNMLHYTAINGHIISSGSLTGTVRTTRGLELGDYTTVFPLTCYFDNVNVSSTNFYVPNVTYAANVWASDINNIVNPTTLKNLYYKEINGDIIWGRVQKEDIASLVAEYDWVWYNQQIWIYSPTDPNTRYVGAELCQRTGSIYLNDKEYISIDGLELSYAHYGIYDFNNPPITLQGLKVRNCHIHHVGVREAGYGISFTHSNVLIRDNVIHDTGRRGITISTANIVSGTVTVENVVIEKNTFYNGHHTTGVDILNHEGGVMNNIVIRKNFIYDDPTAVIDGIEIFASNGMFIANQGGTPPADIYVYNNILKNVKGVGLAVEDLASCFVYNNTFYGVNPTLNQGGLGFIGNNTATLNMIIKNNAFYSNADHLLLPSYYNLWLNDGNELTSNNNLFFNTDVLTRFIRWKGVSYNMDQWAAYKTATSQDALSPTPADPKFISSSDFHLQSGSPCINAGVDVGLTEDYEGNPIVGVPDIGAYEYQP